MPPQRQPHRADARGVHLRAGTEIIHRAPVVPIQDARPGDAGGEECLGGEVLVVGAQRVDRVKPGGCAGLELTQGAELLAEIGGAGFRVHVLDTQPAAAEVKGVNHQHCVTPPRQFLGVGPAIAVLAILLRVFGLAHVTDQFLVSPDERAAMAMLRHHARNLAGALRGQEQSCRDVIGRRGADTQRFDGEPVARLAPDHFRAQRFRGRGVVQQSQELGPDRGFPFGQGFPARVEK